MEAILFIGAATVCLFLMRSAWRMLVEVPDADRIHAVDRYRRVLDTLCNPNQWPSG